METWHGTEGGYRNHKCRCSLCRAANTRAVQRRHAQLRLKGPPPGSHGKLHTYRLYGCRCYPCCAANSEAAKALYRRRRAPKPRRRGRSTPVGTLPTLQETAYDAETDDKLGVVLKIDFARDQVLIQGSKNELYWTPLNSVRAE